MKSAGLVALAAIALAGCGAHTSAGIGDNRIVLTPQQSQRLVHWFGRLQTCLASQHVRLGTLDVTRKQLTLPVDAALTRRALMRRMLPCAERLGGPPQDASLQVFRGRLIMYLPKACLLDPKVAANI